MNIIDYCKWRGDISFDKDPFNYVDNLIISFISYIPFDKAFIYNKSYTILELYNFLLDNNIEELFDPNSLVKDAPIVLKAMAESIRYKDCKVYNYESILYEKNKEQFSAFMMDLSDNTTVICFRGTDDTLVGWYEDFTLSYTDTASQIDAVHYLNKLCKRFRKYRVIGHSKGGNLALYAAVNCYKFLRRHIIQIISNDGPGLRPDSYSKSVYDEIYDRYIKIVPEYSLFGIIFDDLKDNIVIKSNEDGLMQHAPLSWQCIANQFETVNQICRTSILFKEGFDNFMLETKPSDRKIAIDQLFKALKDSNIKDFNELLNGGIPSFIKALKSINDIDTDAKQTLAKLVKIVIDAYTTEFSENVVSGADMIFDTAKKVGKNVENIFVKNK